MSPLLVELDATPGAKKSFSLYLTNENQSDSASFLAYSMDMIESQEGSYSITEKGSSEFSCADWMQVKDSSFTLGPGETRTINVQVTVPRDVFGGRYGAVVFEPTPEEPPPGEKLGSVVYRFLVPAFVEITIKRFGGVNRKARISDFKVVPVTSKNIEEQVGKGALGFVASVKNEGNIHIEGKGMLILRDSQGRTKRRVPLGGGRGSVIPGATVDFRSVLRRPTPGEYTAKAIITFGSLSPLIAEIPFTVTRTKSSTLGSFKASSFIALDVKPEKLEMKIPPRGFRSITFSFRNDERDTVLVRAYMQDMAYDEEGTLVLLDSSGTGRSCAEWVSLEPQTFAIAPEKRERVRLTLEAPPDKEGGYYSCVVFDASLKGSKEEAISTPFHIPVTLSVPPNLNQAGEIVDLKIEAAAGRPALLVAYFKNTGNVHLKPKGRVSLAVSKKMETTGDMIYVGKPKYDKVGETFFQEAEQYVLPGGIRRMEAGYPNALEAGKYIAEIIIDFGGSQPVTLEKEFTVK